MRRAYCTCSPILAVSYLRRYLRRYESSYLLYTYTYSSVPSIFFYYLRSLIFYSTVFTFVRKYFRTCPFAGSQARAHHPSTRPTTPGGVPTTPRQGPPSLVVLGWCGRSHAVRALGVFSHSKLQGWYHPTPGVVPPLLIAHQISLKYFKVDMYVFCTVQSFEGST
jgi:hypothetical protein